MRRKSIFTYITSFLTVFMLISFAMISAPSSVNASQGDDNSAVNKALNGVVKIIAFNNDSYSSEGIYYYSGSGFGVGKSGESTDTFITNWHVVTNYEENEDTGEILSQETFDNIYILLEDDNLEFSLDDQGNLMVSGDNLVKCEVLYKTEGYPDFAVLKAERVINERIALPLMSAENAKQTDTVYAAGFPGVGDLINTSTSMSASVSSMTVTMGTISRLTVYSEMGDTKVIQTDLDINNGNSGGPLLTDDGAVIGINTYTVMAQSSEGVASKMTCSVYIDYVMDKLDEMGISYDIYKESVSLKQYIIIPVIIVVLLILILLFVYIRKMNKREEQGQKEIEKLVRQMQGEVDQAKQEALALKIKMLEDERKKQSSTLFRTRPKDRSKDVVIPETVVQSDTGYRLQSINGAFQQRRFAIGAMTKIGTESGNSIVFPAGTPGISRKHCEIMVRDGMVYLRDVGSSYGTFCNNRKLPVNQWVRLEQGDVFYLASSSESFRIDRKF